MNSKSTVANTNAENQTTTNSTPIVARLIFTCLSLEVTSCPMVWYGMVWYSRV